MKNLVLFALGSILFFVSCSKTDLPGDLSNCIESEIENFEKDQRNCEGASVVEYKFQGQNVFVFNLGGCIFDGTSDVKNSNCEVVCVLGGFAGVSECNGEEFHLVAEEIRVVWEN